MTTGGYDVLRMIEHNQSCYVSSEYIHGEPLIRWLKYHPNLSKKQLYTWIQKITRRLGQFHKCRGNPCYKYVNPYSIIITEDGELYFLDLKAESNKNELHKMLRRAVRDNFLPPQGSYYQQASEELDLYGLGKTIQYLLAVSEPEPALTKREELKFQKIISRCLNRQSKRAYQDISDILKSIPICKKETKEKTDRKPAHNGGRVAVSRAGKIVAVSLAAVVLTAALLIYKDISGDIRASQNERKKGKETQRKTEEVKGMDGAGKLQFEMGMLHLLETGDYEKARECFQMSEGQLSESFAVIAEEFAGGEDILEKEKLRQSLALAEKSMAAEDLPDQGKTDCLRSLVKGYSMLDTEKDAEAVIRLGKEFLAAAERVGGLKDEEKQENIEYMAAAYEKTGETEQSIEKYEELLSQEGEQEKREALYRKLAVLWEQAGKQDMAWECCRQGIEEYEDSASIWLLYIQMQLKDTAVDRAVCAQTVQECIKKIPEITQQEEYKKLQREYEIHMEGENVCIGK